MASSVEKQAGVKRQADFFALIRAHKKNLKRFVSKIKALLTLIKGNPDDFKPVQSSILNIQAMCNGMIREVSALLTNIHKEILAGKKSKEKFTGYESSLRNELVRWKKLLGLCVETYNNHKAAFDESLAQGRPINPREKLTHGGIAHVFAKAADTIVDNL